MAHWSLIVIGILALTCRVSSEESSKYDNYTFVRFFPTNEGEWEALRNFNDPQNQVEVLKQSRALNDSLDLLVPPSKLSLVEDYANGNRLNIEIKKENYGRKFLSEERGPRRRVLNGANVFEYKSYAAILEFTEALARANPSRVQVQPLGGSYQNRRMSLLKISTKPDAGNPIIFIDAGIHAREWVAPAMAVYLIHRLVTDPEAWERELNGVDWYILPVVNPDGYEYSRSSRANRMWRKTRSRHVDSCFGVDGNRNYGFKWAVSGVSNNPCDMQTYAGPAPFSEPETKIVKNIMAQYSKRIKLYVSLHAYGQYLVYPWGYTGSYLPKEWKKLHTMAKMVSDGVVRAGGQPFKVLSAGKWYPAAGGSDDYAFGAIGVPYSYTMELTDGYEFDYPASLLPKVLPQFYEGFKVFGARIKAEFSGRSFQKREAIDGFEKTKYELTL